MAEIFSLFPCPLYHINRGIDLSHKEETDLKNITDNGFISNKYNSICKDTYVFNNKLEKLKQFCEDHIKIYVENIISPKEEVKFYITQSWINKTRSNEEHHLHTHPNSIISGVFYIRTVEEDKISFGDPNWRIKERVKFQMRTSNTWNTEVMNINVTKNDLILFPSWLDHFVPQNPQATTDRISLSFNTFFRGNLGNEDGTGLQNLNL
tara:strand:- start:277 stop:900 length:624 start_codon:yes stop_codon:yes gene_type:complete